MNKMKKKYRSYLEKYMVSMLLEDFHTVVYVLDISELQPDDKDVKSQMPKYRYDKMITYQNKIDRSRLFGNELVIRYELERILPNTKWETIIREVDRDGKPFLKGREDLFFNMSHSGTYSVCVFSDSPIGVDIERIGEFHLGIAKRFYCHHEYEQLQCLTMEEQKSKFYEYWVLKESFVKAVGLGMKIPLNSFHFVEVDDAVLEVHHEVNGNTYFSKIITFQNREYKLAVSKEITLGVKPI